jgi:uncharacterized Zn-finger protein
MDGTAGSLAAAADATGFPYHFRPCAAIVGTIVRISRQKAHPMAAIATPHFANDKGVEKIFVGVKELKCMGARPPFDHPHVFLDMGADSQILCPYCSTLFVHDTRLAAGESDPKGCLVTEHA